MNEKAIEAAHKAATEADRRALAVVKEYLTARLPEAASLIQSQAARIAELEAGLDEAIEALDWASRRMKGNCARDDVSAVALSASRARAILNKENQDD